MYDLELSNFKEDRKLFKIYWILLIIEILIISYIKFSFLIIEIYLLDGVNIYNSNSNKLFVDITMIVVFFLIQYIIYTIWTKGVGLNIYEKKCFIFGNSKGAKECVIKIEEDILLICSENLIKKIKFKNISKLILEKSCLIIEIENKEFYFQGNEIHEIYHELDMKINLNEGENV